MGEIQYRTSCAPDELSDYIWVKTQLRSHDEGLFLPDEQGASTIVALIDDTSAGGIIFTDRLGWTHIEMLWVQPANRRQGIAQGLLGLVEHHSLQAERLGLRVVTTSGHDALHLYLTLGFGIDAQYPLLGTKREGLKEVLLSKRR